MRILVVESNQDEILEARKQLSKHEIEIMQSNREFLAHAKDEGFISSFDAVLLSNMFLSDSGRVLAVNGLVIASNAIKESVPYVGMFSYTDYIISAWARLNQVKIAKNGQLAVAKIKDTFFGSMITERKRSGKDWTGLLSGLVAAGAN